MSIQDRVRFFLDDRNIKQRAKIIVGCSGGMDSMCLASVMYSLGYAIEIAHINYGLRGASSDLDEQLVASWSKNLGIPFHVHHAQLDADTTNMQHIAREIRYGFFASLSPDFTAIAHHASDQIETGIIQLLRGQHVHGMSDQTHKTIRPLLHVPKEDIITYVQHHKIPYRQDASNDSDKYLRNRVRHHILPTIVEHQDHAYERINRSIAIGSFYKDLREAARKRWMKKYTTPTEDGLFEIDKELLSEEDGIIIFKAILLPIGFSETQLEQIILADIGKHVDLDPIYLVKQRNSFLLTSALPIKDDSTIRIAHPGHFTFKETEILLAIKTTVDGNETSEYADYEKIKWPLTVRRWKDGDKIAPLGMHGKKKLISDVLKDDKIEPVLKNTICVLEDKNGSIIWTSHGRISEDVKYSEHTRNYLEIRLIAGA